MLDYEIKEAEQKPWGYETRVKVIDIKGNNHSITVVFPREPGNEFLKREVERRVLKFEEQLNEPEIEPEKLYTVEKINETLRREGYFTEEDNFEEISEGIK